MFKRRQVDRSVILPCVRRYLACYLSLRDLEEMRPSAASPSITPPSTAGRFRFKPLLQERFNRRKRSVTGKWHFDEIYIKAHGVWMYLYRAIDSVRDTVGSLFSSEAVSMRFRRTRFRVCPRISRRTFVS